MIVFDLRCGAGHVFEAWFGSSDAWEQQRSAGQVRCPTCDNPDVTKAMMAPNVATKGHTRSPAPSLEPAQFKAAVKALAAAQAKALEGSTWVGDSFARRARAMHDGEESAVAIHGQASLAEAKALVEEGVPVAPLPLPVVPPDRIN